MPFTIAMLLLIIEIVALCFVFYSIRRIRCCQLEIEWERVEIGQVIRVKLEELVREVCGEGIDNDYK